jgi:signal transduction histidine kinase
MCIEAAEENRRLGDDKGIEFAVEVDKSVGTVTGDRRRLRQALDNILDNAFAYTLAGGRVLLHAAGSGSEASITVSDSGAGIAPSDQTRVFDRFHRSMVAGAGRDEALGLGLPLAKQFVEAHRGSIELQSEVGVGTTVTIRLPRDA